jgi:hypothetical protein
MFVAYMLMHGVCLTEFKFEFEFHLFEIPFQIGKTFLLTLHPFWPSFACSPARKILCRPLFFPPGSRAPFFFSPVASSAGSAVAQRSCGPRPSPAVADWWGPPVIPYLRSHRAGSELGSVPHRARARSWPWARMPRPPPVPIKPASPPSSSLSPPKTLAPSRRRHRKP